MKTNKKQLLTALLTGVVTVILFVGGCKKEISTLGDSLDPEVLMSQEGAGIQKNVLRESSGLKFKVTSETISRISPTFKGKDKLNEILQPRKGKKSQPPKIMAGSGTMTATPQYGGYIVYGNMPTAAPYDWYLLNENTLVLTYIGSTSNGTILFYMDKPYFPASFTLYVDNPHVDGTNSVSMGDAPTGVTISGGMLVFDDANSAEVLYNRLESAYEAHQAFLFDAYDHLTDDEMDAQAIAQGYDEWLPMKEFEAYFGLSSLRQYYQAQVDAYNANGTSATCTNPNVTFAVDDEIFQTMLTSGGEMQIGESVEELNVSNPVVCEPTVCTGTGCYDEVDKVISDTLGSIIVEKIIRQRPRQTSNWFPAVLRATAKGKVMIWKITGSTSRRPYSTKMKVRIYGTATDGRSNPVLNLPCGASLGAWDTGFNSYRRRWQRRQNNKWNATPVFIPTCGLYAQYDLNNYGMFYMNR